MTDFGFKAMERRKRSTSNAALAPGLVWRIKQAIIEEQWSPRQISGALKREGVSVSHQSIYNIIMPMRPVNWQVIRAISSDTGADPNARLLPLPVGPVSTNAPKRQMENGSGISRWI